MILAMEDIESIARQVWELNTVPGDGAPRSWDDMSEEAQEVIIKSVSNVLMVLGDRVTPPDARLTEHARHASGVPCIGEPLCQVPPDFTYRVWTEPDRPYIPKQRVG